MMTAPGAPLGVAFLSGPSLPWMGSPTSSKDGSADVLGGAQALAGVSERRNEPPKKYQKVGYSLVN